MDGWIARWMDRWMDVRIDGWVAGWKVYWMDGCIDRWVDDRRMDERMDSLMVGYMDECVNG
jgi:hypothetical protein